MRTLRRFIGFVKSEIRKNRMEVQSVPRRVKRGTKPKGQTKFHSEIHY